MDEKVGPSVELVVRPSCREDRRSKVDIVLREVRLGTCDAGSTCCLLTSVFLGLSLTYSTNIGLLLQEVGLVVGVPAVKRCRPTVG